LTIYKALLSEEFPVHLTPIAKTGFEVKDEDRLPERMVVRMMDFAQFFAVLFLFLCFIPFPLGAFFSPSNWMLFSVYC